MWEAGTDRPILYLHGSGAAKDMVFSVERDLLLDGFRLIVPNRLEYENTPLSCGKSSPDCADLVADHFGQYGGKPS
jgi:hypothetical protein